MIERTYSKEPYTQLGKNYDSRVYDLSINYETKYIEKVLYKF